MKKTEAEGIFFLDQWQQETADTAETAETVESMPSWRISKKFKYSISLFQRKQCQTLTLKKIHKVWN